MNIATQISRSKNPERKKNLSYPNGPLTAGEDLLVKICDSNTQNERPLTAFRSTAYAVILITKGILTLKVNFVEHEFKPRDIIFVFPDSIYEIIKEVDLLFISTHFNKNYLSRRGIFLSTAESYLIFREQSSIKFSLSKPEYKHIYHDMMALYNKMDIPKDTRYVKDIIHNSFLSILYDLFLLNEKRKQVPQIVMDSRVELTNRFLTLVSERFRTEKRVSYYAGCLRITPRHLSQVVKQVTNRTAGEHIDEFVLREAQLLLAGHAMNISEIAEALSFSNSSFFGKYFKKHTGFSPLSFKQSTNIAI